MAESSAHMQSLNTLRYCKTGARFANPVDSRRNLIKRANDSVFHNSSNLQLGDLNAHNGQQINYNIPVIDLTDDNEHYADHNIPVIDLTDDSSDQYTGHNVPVIDLTDDSDQYTGHNILVTDLTDENDRYTGNFIPVIDLTDDNHQYTGHNISIIDLTDDNDRYTGHNIQVFELTDDNDEGINGIELVTDLTDDSDQCISYNIPVIDLTDDNNQDSPVTPSIRHKCQDNNRCLPVVDLKNNLTKDNAEYIVDSIPIIELTEGVIVNNDFSRMPIEDLYDVENAVNKTKMLILNKLPSNTSDKLHNGNQGLPDMNLSSCSMIKCFEDKEYSLRKHANFSQSKRHSNTIPKGMSDPEPLSHPILLRRSLSRSNVNTSKKVLIGCSHRDQDELNTYTASSFHHKEKSKSFHSFSKQSSLDSSDNSRSVQTQKLPVTNEDKVLSLATVFFCFWTFIFAWILKSARRIVYFK